MKNGEDTGAVSHTAATTAPKVRGRPFPKGVSGNPKGRTKGSRNKFADDFGAAFQANFRKNGPQTIEEVRLIKPADYLKAAVAILPRHVEADVKSARAMRIECTV